MLIYSSRIETSSPKAGLLWIYRHFEQILSQLNPPRARRNPAGNTKTILLHLLTVFSSTRTLSINHGYPGALVSTGTFPGANRAFPTLHTRYEFGLANLTKSTLKTLIRQGKVDQMLRLCSYWRWQQRYWVTEQSWLLGLFSAPLTGLFPVPGNSFVLEWNKAEPNRK